MFKVHIEEVFHIKGTYPIVTGETQGVLAAGDFLETEHGEFIKVNSVWMSAPAQGEKTSIGLMVSGHDANKLKGTTLVKRLEFSKNDEQIVVNENELFYLTTEANPSTGYLWRTTQISEGLEVIKELYKGDSEDRVGGGGKQMWLLKANTKGKLKLNIELLQPWANEAIDKKEYEIETR